MNRLYAKKQPYIAKTAEKISCIVKTNPQMTYENLLKHEVWYDENIHLEIR